MHFSQNDNDNNDNSTADVLYPLANGVDEGLTVILRTNPNMNWKDPSQTFKIAIGSPGDLLDFRVGAAELDPGHSYTFQIFSSEVTTSTQVKELPLFKRDCRTRSESADMKIFEVREMIVRRGPKPILDVKMHLIAGVYPEWLHLGMSTPKSAPSLWLHSMELSPD